MVAIMAYDDVVIWFMGCCIPLERKGRLITLSPVWRSIMPPDTNFLLSGSAAGSELSRQGKTWSITVRNFPSFPRDRNSRSAHAAGRNRDGGEHTETSPEAMSRSSGWLAGILKYFTTRSCANNSVSEIMIASCHLIMGWGKCPGCPERWALVYLSKHQVFKGTDHTKLRFSFYLLSCCSSPYFSQCLTSSYCSLFDGTAVVQRRAS